MTTSKITGDETIGEVLHAIPRAGEILFDAGLGCAMCPHAQFENLRDGCRAHGFSEHEITELIDSLNKAE